MKHPYSVPNQLSADLDRVLAYWRGLLRGSAEMPFADDVNLSDLPDLNDRLLLIDVFERPQRFRFNRVGAGLSREALAGVFIDEIDLKRPFDLLRTQCCSTVETATPSYFRRQGEESSQDARGYARLLLPLWGEGRVGMLLGLVDFS